MAQRTRTYLKGKFETGDIPSEQDFSDTIDSNYNITDDDADVLVDGTFKKLMTASERTKLAGIESGAQVNQTVSEINGTSKSTAFIANLSNPPSVVSLFTSFSSSVIVTRTDVGQYTIQSTGNEYRAGRTLVFLQSSAQSVISAVVASESVINITTYNSSGDAADAVVTSASVKVEVY
jgi:hypothetical protein